MRRLALAAALAAALAPPVRAQIPEAEYAARRDSLAARLGEGVLVALGGRSPVDPRAEFVQLPAFRYLTGFVEPDAALVIEVEAGRPRPTLFVDAPTLRRQMYDGFREAPIELAARTRMRVRPLREFEAYADSIAGGAARAGRPMYDLGDQASGDYAAADSLTRGRVVVDRLRARHPSLEVRDAHETVLALRARKSAAELALLRRAIEITDEAHRAALGVVRPGAYEYEAEAAIEGTFRRLGAERPSFASIVGSGPNATVLHYVANDRRMEAGDVVVMDIGAEVEGYAADVTRTIPVSGRFTPEQRQIYDLVLAAQLAAERVVRPGGSAVASVDSSVAVRLRGLAALGLVESEEAQFDPPWPADCGARPQACRQGQLWMVHGISHGIGLEVHDPASFYGPARQFSVGDVFTIEPGLYVSRRVLGLLPDTPRNRQFVAAVGAAVARYDNTGVRIEDDYVLTETGLERLSDGSPREPEEIERVMAESAAAAR